MRSVRVHGLPMLLAALSGLSLAWSIFLLGPWWTGCFALVPLAFAVDHFARTPWRAAAFGWLAGAVAQAVGLSFLVSTAERFFELSWPASVFWCSLLYLVQGAQVACFAGVLAQVRQRGWPMAWALGPVWVATEWLWPMLLPTPLATALAEHPWAVQPAALGGVPLVSAVLAVSNGAMYAGVEVLRAGGGTWRRATGPLALAACAWAASLGYAKWSAHALQARMDEAPAVELGLIQANVSPAERRADPEGTLRRHLKLSRRAELRRPPPDLLVWPESAMRQVADARDIRRKVQTPLLFGGIERHGKHLYNTAFFASDPEGPVQRYHKQRLLAFAEFVPLSEWLPWLRAGFPHSGNFSPGDSFPPLRLGEHRFGVLICYEDMLGGHVRALVRQARPQLLLGISNDAWFDDPEELRLHAASARFRAVEHRLYLARAGQTGRSGVIDPLGREVQTGIQRQPLALRATARWLEPSTFYAYVGPWPAWLAAACTLVLGCRRRR